MGDRGFRFAFEQIDEGDRGLFLGTGGTVGLQTMPVFVSDGEFLGKLLGEFKAGRFWVLGQMCVG
jgi:hypothetical protein